MDALYTFGIILPIHFLGLMSSATKLHGFRVEGTGHGFGLLAAGFRV